MDQKRLKTEKRSWLSFEGKRMPFIFGVLFLIIIPSKGGQDFKYKK
jgi:hypothetical protein